MVFVHKVFAPGPGTPPQKIFMKLSGLIRFVRFRLSQACGFGAGQG
jgi:hypothetical protein